jgi:hypothetical protein
MHTAPMRASGNEQIDEATRLGTAAALTLARRLGLPTEDARVLSSRGNLIVHLAPAPVVARVATLSAFSRLDPFAWLAREVAVAGYVAGQGGPVTAPSSLADPGPYWQDGFVISLWEHVVALDVSPDPAEVGVALARLHHVARDCRAELGEMSTVREHISDGLAVIGRESIVDEATLLQLRSVHARVLRALAAAGGDSIVLHGDAHAGNMLAVSGRGLLWIDLEETCRGPAAWDLATVTRHYGVTSDEARIALSAYATETGTAVPGPEELAPFHRARELEGTVWTLCMAHLYPARYAKPARELLGIVLADAVSGA